MIYTPSEWRKNKIREARKDLWYCVLLVVLFLLVSYIEVAPWELYQ